MSSGRGLHLLLCLLVIPVTLAVGLCEGERNVEGGRDTCTCREGGRGGWREVLKEEKRGSGC